MSAVDSRGDFVQIRTENGRTGWVPRSAVERNIHLLRKLRVQYRDFDQKLLHTLRGADLLLRTE